MYWVLNVGLFAGGMLVGTLISWLSMRKKVRMFQILWENEKNGNFLMTKRITTLECERMDIEGEE